MSGVFVLRDFLLVLLHGFHFDYLRHLDMGDVHYLLRSVSVMENLKMSDLRVRESQSDYVGVLLYSFVVC